MKLTAKQEMFITEYMKDLNATQAAIRSGYKENTAKEIGYENLTKPHIKEIIDKRLEERARNNGITAEFVLNGIKAIAVQGEKQTDQLKAYELLGKHLKLFTEKVESENINNNFNKDITEMSDSELDKELKKLR